MTCVTGSVEAYPIPKNSPVSATAHPLGWFATASVTPFTLIVFRDDRWQRFSADNPYRNRWDFTLR